MGGGSLHVEAADALGLLAHALASPLRILLRKRDARLVCSRRVRNVFGWRTRFDPPAARARGQRPCRLQVVRFLEGDCPRLILRLGVRRGVLALGV